MKAKVSPLPLMDALSETQRSIAPATAREAKLREIFFRGCGESLLMDRKDRVTVSG